MNTELSPTAELALKKHVERAVRPLVATEHRKLRIREELLSHLVGIYHSERQRHDESAAVARACERFGSPIELTRELHAALPFVARFAGANERYERALDRFWSQSPNEPLLRYMFRSVAAITLFTFVLVFGVVGAFSLFGGPRDNWAFLAKLLPLIVLGQSSAVFAAVAVEKLTAKRAGLMRWLILAVHTVAWSSLLMVSTSGFWWWISGQPFSPPAALRVGLTLLLAIGFVMVLIAFACDYSRRRKAIYDAWRLLPIDEE